MDRSRRRFIQVTALAGAGALVSRGRLAAQVAPPKWNLTKFAAPLRGLGGSGIPVAAADRTRYPATDFYRIVMGQYRHTFHPELPSSRVWGYADATSGLPRWSYLGPAILATEGTPVRVNFVNNLPGVHPLPVDTTLPGAETGQAVNRAAVHLHGLFGPWASDGGPYQWFAPDGTHGPSLVPWLLNRSGVLTNDFWYPNAQTSRFLWYHDHAAGLTRQNVYIGLAAPFFISDPDEIRMFGPRTIDRLSGMPKTGTVLDNQAPGIPLVLQDKMFKISGDQWGGPGDLDYLSSYGPPEPGSSGTPPLVSCVPEFFADNIVINGVAYPQLTLPAGVHRFRILNAANSRMFNLQLYPEYSSTGEPDLTGRAPDFVQVGNEGGFLPRPVVIPSNNQLQLQPDVDGSIVAVNYVAHAPNAYSLFVGNAERADVLIDFSSSAGQSFILYSDAPAPFPAGDPGNDYFTGGNLSTGSQYSGGIGKGPNTRTLMRIRIKPANYSGPTMASNPNLVDVLTQELAKTKLGLVVPDLLIGRTFNPPPGVRHRIKTLNEGVDSFGRLIQFIGTQRVTNLDGTKYGQRYLDPVTGEDKYFAGATEVWDIYNTTGDVHPIHFHLVNLQIMGRAPFAQDANGNPVSFSPSGPWIPPDENEHGFKETVRMNPGEVVRVVMKFDLPPNPFVYDLQNQKHQVTVPVSPRTGGYEYVMHCHILEHEEHDMMRPIVVI